MTKTTSVDGLLSFIKADTVLEHDILNIYVPKNFKGMIPRIKKAEKELLEKFGARKLRVDDKKKEAVELTLNTLKVKILDSISDDLIKLVDSNTHMAIDFETDDTDGLRAKVISVGLCFLDNKETFYIPIEHTNAKNVPIEVVMEFLNYAANKVRFIVHNLSFEKKILNRYKVYPEFDDTMILTYLKGGLKTNKLKEVVALRLQERMTTFKEVTTKDKKKIKFEDVDVNIAAEYCGADAYYSARLFDLLYKDIKPELYKLDIESANVCSNMEVRGVCIDVEALNKLSNFCETRRKRLEQLIFHQAGEEFNINSPKQLGGILYDKLGMEPGKKNGFTKSGAFATGAEAVEELISRGESNKILTYLSSYRNMVKINGTYVGRILEGLKDDTRRYHPYFNFVGTDTGRLSSDFQQLPATGWGSRVRAAVVPPRGFKIVTADYSQIELRLLAHLMQDDKVNQMLKDGVDLHTATASIVFGIPLESIGKDSLERRVGKTMNFAIVYGRGDSNVASDLNVSLAQAKEFKEKYFAGFPKLKKLIEDTINSTKSKGYSETMTGRRRYLPNINLKGMSRKVIAQVKAAERQAFNAVIQGSAADLMRQAMPIAEKLVIKYGGELVLQVHDELCFYVPEDKAEEFSKAIKTAMELDNICGIKIDVPIEVDVGIGDTYWEAK